MAHHADGQVKARQVIVAVGRKPRVAGLSLESVGIEPTPAGIAVDERCRAAEGVWAVGDVTGETPFTHVAMYQARIAVADSSVSRRAPTTRPCRASCSPIPRSPPWG